MIAYASAPILNFVAGLGFVPGSEVNTVAVLVDSENVLSVQPDGRYETRPRTAVGAWESAVKVGDKLVYRVDGKVFVVPFVEVP